MSKSRENTIDLFEDENLIKKTINKNVITDNSPLEAPKDPNNSTVYHLYNLIASSEKSSNGRRKSQSRRLWLGTC